jgi:hypothetical protein
MDLSTLRPEVRINAPADDALLNFFILRGAIDFFTRSEAWQVTEEVALSAGDESFQVPAVPHGEFSKLISIQVADTVIEGADLNRFCASGESGTVWLAQKAPGDMTIKVKSVYVPDEAATTIDDAIGRQYRNALIDAALDKLHKLPKKPWTDFTLSTYHRSEWERKADEAKRMAYTGKQNGPIRTESVTIGGR